MFGLLNLLSIVRVANAVSMDYINCGLDEEQKVFVGAVSHEAYPWYGVLYYTQKSDNEETRSVTPVVLVHEAFVLACASDVAPMPSQEFSELARVLLGVDWHDNGRAVKSYVIHPEYGDTVNTLALVQLAEPVIDPHIKPVCPPPDLIHNPEFYVIRFDDDFNVLQKHVLQASHVPGDICKDFYLRSMLYSKRHRPPHVTCSTSLLAEPPCVWGAGAALVMRDPWGRWQLLGLGARGPGCGAPARFMDMMSYQPWLRESLDNFRPITVSRIDDRTVIFRQGADENDLQMIGDCINVQNMDLMYRDFIYLSTNRDKLRIIDYSLEIIQGYTISCLRAQVLDASLTAHLRFIHKCPRRSDGGACYMHKGSVSRIKITVIYTESVIFEIIAFGKAPKHSLRLLDKHIWKLEEGVTYPDFEAKPEELYRGGHDEYFFGFDPLINPDPSRQADVMKIQRDKDVDKMPDFYGTTAAPETEKVNQSYIRAQALKRNEEMYKHPYGYFYRGYHRYYLPVYFEFEDPTVKVKERWMAYGWFHKFRNGTPYPAPPGEPKYPETVEDVSWMNINNWMYDG